MHLEEGGYDIFEGTLLTFGREDCGMLCRDIQESNPHFNGTNPECNYIILHLHQTPPLLKEEKLSREYT